MVGSVAAFRTQLDGEGTGSKGGASVALLLACWTGFAGHSLGNPSQQREGPSQVTQACHLSRERHLGMGFRHGKDMGRVLKGDSRAVLCAELGSHGQAGPMSTLWVWLQLRWEGAPERLVYILGGDYSGQGPLGRKGQRGESGSRWWRAPARAPRSGKGASYLAGVGVSQGWAAGPGACGSSV